MPAPKTRDELSLYRLRAVLDYDPTVGVFTWKERTNSRGINRIGTKAGKTDPNGYVYVRLDKRDYLAQRLAWFYVNGEWPDRILRFKDGNKQNFAIDNLALPAFDARTPEGKREYQRGYRNRRFEVLRASDLRKDFGLSLDVYQALFVKQGGVCAICMKPERDTRNGKVKWLAVDHCHDTHVVRGLLCAACNTGLGKLGDDPAMLRAAADYIEASRKAEGENVIRLISRRAN